MQILNNKYSRLFLVISFLYPSVSLSEVCSTQEVIPPFLTESVPANVMLLIDNSASMYDMAYDDIEEPGFCNDNSYIEEGTIQQDAWSAITTYPAGAHVHVLTWNATDQAWQKKWYKAKNLVTGGNSPETSASWTAAEWKAGTSYPADSIIVIENRFVQEDQSVSYSYNWYKAIQDATSTAADPTCYNSTDPASAQNCWRSIPAMYGGYFENDVWYKWDDTEQLFAAIASQPADSSAACTAVGANATNQKYYNSDLCEVIQPYGFSYTLIGFAAKGNYLNWLASSKLDVEKKVLTGGKYVIETATNFVGSTIDSYLELESRGCLGRKMIRQVNVVDGTGASKVLTLAVSPGEESSQGIGDSLNDCLSDCSTADLSSCENECENKCTPSCQDDTCSENCISTLASCTAACGNGNSAAKIQCRDTCSNNYNTCLTACVPDENCLNTCESDCSDNCLATCENTCTESWANAGLRPEISRIQFFPPTNIGFQFGNTACEAALEASAFGQVQNLAGDCLEIGKQNESFAESNAAFNHGFQTCWGYPTVGNGDITRMVNACKNIYVNGISATDIDITDGGYVCSGDPSNGSGYVGRCFEGLDFSDASCVMLPCPPSLEEGERCVNNLYYACPTGYEWDDSLATCLKLDKDGNPDPAYQSPSVVQYAGNCKIDWVDNYDNAGGCVELAIRDYCGEYYNPPVPDAERPVDSVADEQFPNLPAILVDVATNAQLGDPFKTVPARVRVNQKPEGLLQRTAGDLRIGAMTFNSMGTAWEVDNSPDPNTAAREAFYGCDPTDANCKNRDGSVVIDYISADNDIETLVKSINSIKALSWTPMSEALFNAIGYYTRNTNLRLSPNDFYIKNDTINTYQDGANYSLGNLVKDDTGDVYWAVTDGKAEGSQADLKNGKTGEVEWAFLANTSDPDPDPVIAYCQSNNILVLTDGAPTADWEARMQALAVANANGSTDITNQCGRYYGSTYPDNIANYGQSGTDIYPVEQFATLYQTAEEDAKKENIQTYVVSTGVLRTDGTENECRADVLLEQTAKLGGTDQYYPGEDFVQLEEQLTRIFLTLRQRASAGSAASVISASRGGEGAVYQAIFWPEQNTVNPTSGEERSVAWVGEVHGLFVDSNGYMFEDSNGDRTLNPSEDINGNGVCDTEDTNGNGILDSEDSNCNGVLDNEDTYVVNGILDHEDPNCNGTFDVATEDINGDGETYPTNEDTDCDGIIDNDLNGNGIIDNEDPNCNGIFDREDANCNGILDIESDLNNDGKLTTEDTNGNCQLDQEDIYKPYGTCTIYTAGSDVDRRVLIYFDQYENSSRGCYDLQSYFTYQAQNISHCDNNVDLDSVGYIWSAKDWLNHVPESLNDPEATTNRTYDDFQGDSAHQRYIFTWNDLNNDGIVNYGSGYGHADSEVFPFEANAKTWNADLASFNPVKVRGPVINDFNPPVIDNTVTPPVSSNAEVNKIINWVRGVEDIPADATFNPRPRKIYKSDGTDFTWKLGDVIHSTPMTVAAPAEGFQFLYGDASYAQFAQKYGPRRNMIYFGANDGMLHAVNGGFYDTNNKKFCLVPLVDNECPADEISTNPPALGAEMWAYVPYNLQPHLRCLTDKDYKHKYMVDLRPRIFDVQIFQQADGTSIDQDRYPNGWGTILVGGMRLGGAEVDASDLSTGDPNDTRRFISSYFILDITDPEVPPTLLGEFTQTLDNSGNPEFADLGHSTVIPTMSIMKDTNGTISDYTDDYSKWYLVFGSGPHGTNAMKGESDQVAKLAILPLDGLITDQYGSTGIEATRSIRILPDPTDMDANNGGTINLTSSPNGFVSDPVTIDYDISPSVADYKSDAIYFGTVEGKLETNHPTTGQPYWKGGGKMYRLIMRETDYSLDGTDYNYAYGIGIKQLNTTPEQWEIKPLLSPFEDLDRDGIKDANENGQPITASASVGYDGHNFWVYFGTGRYYDFDDKTDKTQQSYYGIKEPMQWIINEPGGEQIRRFTWESVELDGSGSVAGSKGLLKVDEILVPESARASDARLLCRNVTTGEIRGTLASPDMSCLPSEILITEGANEIAYFDHPTEVNLEDYIAGKEEVDSSDNKTNIDECQTSSQNCVDGWYRDFWPYQNRERNLGQATLLGGLVTYTTYQPFADPCRAEGEAYLYGVYYKTGTPWYEDVFGTFSKSNTVFVSEKLSLGQGLATTPNLHVGTGDQDGEGPKAFIQTSTGAIREIKQENLPIDTYRTGRSKWKEYHP